MIRMPTVASGLLLSALAATGAWSAQQPVFSSSTTRVRLDVSVFSSSGTVRGLGAGDFVVREHGQDIDVLDVVELSDLPVDLVIVAQTRASLTPDQDRVFAASLAALMSRTRQGDRVAAITTDTPPRLVLPLGPPHDQLDLSADGATESTLWDAIALALRQFDSAERRHVIAVFSTGTDRRSLLPSEVVVQSARRARAHLVYFGFDVVPTATIRLSTDPSTRRVTEESSLAATNRFPPAALKKLADETGGQVVNLASGDPEALVRGVVDRLRFGYLVSFAPQPGSGWHPVQVTVRRRGVDVSARAGYYR